MNLPLNMEKPHYRSQRAGEWSLIWAHDSSRIYRALTYIAVPLLGPHQPRYIGLTLYCVNCIDGLVQDCSNSIANAMELLQSCAKPSVFWQVNAKEMLLKYLNTICPIKSRWFCCAFLFFLFFFFVMTEVISNTDFSGGQIWNCKFLGALGNKKQHSSNIVLRYTCMTVWTIN